MDVTSRSTFSSRLASEQSLETVRALHETIVSLRSALEESRSELFQLRVKYHSTSNIKLYTDTIEKLSLENHILRQKVLSSSTSNLDSEITRSVDKSASNLMENPTDLVIDKEGVEDDEKAAKTEDESAIKDQEANDCNAEQDIKNENETVLSPTDSGAMVVQDVTNDEIDENQSVEEVSGDQKSQVNGLESKAAADSDNESEEVDDIELIFTTDETKELSALQEDLVSISDTENWGIGNDQQSPSTTVEKSTQFDVENTGLRIPLSSTWAHVPVVETDISKCGIIDETEVPTVSPFRRSTIANPTRIYNEISLPAKYFSHGSSSAASSKTSNLADLKSAPLRPILMENNNLPKKESEAQTDITALPSHWKSESYLAHKVSHQFTTLPSKFTLPTRQTMLSRPSLKICDRSHEARRILLSDINFTSMVPELSRSADHLALESGAAGAAGSAVPPRPSVAGLYRNFPRAFSYMKTPDQMGACLVSPGYQHSREYGRFPWSPCECLVQGKWDYTPRYQSSQSSVASPPLTDLDGKHHIKPSSSSLDMCRHGQLVQRSLSSSSWQSEPASPTHCKLHGHTRNSPFAAQCRSKPQNSVFSYGSRNSSGTNFASSHIHAKNKVTFQENTLRRPGRGGQSLPDLRINGGHGDSGDSTDSLIDEAEDYVRRSIDSIVMKADAPHGNKKRITRRYSDPDPVREFTASKSIHPFLPKVPGDLKLDNLVKVITSEGRVTVGWVRYIGAIAGLAEPHVGVELPNQTGDSDGTLRGRRYFECKQGHATFVPFKKVIMGWRA